MALKRFEIDGFGQLELNNVSFRRTGQIEAQCALDDTFTKDAPAENGMLLAVDRANRTVKLPTATETLPIAINYTTEHMYDERNNALKDFSLVKGTFLPRMGYLSTGELFTTNCLAYDSSDYTDDAAVKALNVKTTAVYGGISTTGAIKLQKTAPTAGPVLKAVESTTMPDGQFAIKFQVVKA